MIPKRQGYFIPKTRQYSLFISHQDYAPATDRNKTCMIFFQKIQQYMHEMAQVQISLCICKGRNISVPVPNVACCILWWGKQYWTDCNRCIVYTKKTSQNRKKNTTNLLILQWYTLNLHIGISHLLHIPLSQLFHNEWCNLGLPTFSFVSNMVKMSMVKYLVSVPVHQCSIWMLKFPMEIHRALQQKCDLDFKPMQKTSTKLDRTPVTRLSGPPLSFFMPF